MQDHIEIRRRAAMAGPGYRGKRVPLSQHEVRALTAQFEEVQAEPPPYISEPRDWVQREAKLFEAGDYPDKGFSVTEEDLERLERSFDLPVPVLIEHSSSPLELGYLTAVRAEGQDLYGTLAFTPEADALIRRSGATALSLGLTADLNEIREVSLVRNPRVASAQLFRAGHLLPEAHFEAQIRSLVDSGQLTPPQVPIVRALLRTQRSVEFQGTLQPIHHLVMELLNRLPSTKLFGAIAKNPSAAANLPSEKEAFYQRYFPDLAMEQIAQNQR